MKKVSALASLSLLAVALAACGPSAPLPVSSQNVLVYPESGSDVCYDGVVYTKFATGGNAQWGSVKFDSTTKQPVTCGVKK